MKKSKHTPWLICVWMLVTALQLNAQQKKPSLRAGTAGSDACKTAQVPVPLRTK